MDLKQVQGMTDINVYASPKVIEWSAEIVALVRSHGVPEKYWPDRVPVLCSPARLDCCECGEQAIYIGAPRDLRGPEDGVGDARYSQNLPFVGACQMHIGAVSHPLPIADYIAGTRFEYVEPKRNAEGA